MAANIGRTGPGRIQQVSLCISTIIAYLYTDDDLTENIYNLVGN